MSFARSLCIVFLLAAFDTLAWNCVPIAELQRETVVIVPAGADNALVGNSTGRPLSIADLVAAAGGDLPHKLVIRTYRGTEVEREFLWRRSATRGTGLFLECIHVDGRPRFFTCDVNEPIVQPGHGIEIDNPSESDAELRFFCSLPQGWGHYPLTDADNDGLPESAPFEWRFGDLWWFGDFSSFPNYIESGWQLICAPGAVSGTPWRNADGSGGNGYLNLPLKHRTRLRVQDWTRYEPDIPGSEWVTYQFWYHPGSGRGWWTFDGQTREVSGPGITAYTAFWYQSTWTVNDIWGGFRNPDFDWFYPEGYWDAPYTIVYSIPMMPSGPFVPPSTSGITITTVGPSP